MTKPTQILFSLSFYYTTHPTKSTRAYTFSQRIEGKAHYIFAVQKIFHHHRYFHLCRSSFMYYYLPPIDVCVTQLNLNIRTPHNNHNLNNSLTHKRS